MVKGSFRDSLVTVEFQKKDRQLGAIFAVLIIALLCFPLFLPSLLSAASAAAITPERDVVISDTSQDPEWKVLWDEARELTRQARYIEAASSYSRLLSFKKNIEEASWEYSLVLINLSDWDQASILLEQLLEGDPRRTEYLLSAGLVALKKKEFSRAAASYNLVYQKKAATELDQERPEIIEALTGLVAALRGQGKNEAAYPLMEQLLRHRPDDTLLLHQLAAHAAISGRRERASLFYEKLVFRNQVEGQVLLEAADFFDRTGEESRALLSWKKYLQRHPDYLPFQKKMVDYFIARGEKEAALPHLLILLDKGDQRDARLLQIGAIYLFDLGRPDIALSYYEEYSQHHPENQDVAREIARMQMMLAQDLLVRVEHEGALPVWQELVQMTPNRLPIYSAMAQHLEKRRNSKELREVLGVIHQHDPGDRDVILRLAELSLEQNDTEQVKHLLGLLPQEGFDGSRYLLASARLADQQGLLDQALIWYNRYLEAEPSDKSIRLRCLDLSAQLGLISQYEEHYQLARRDATFESERLHSDLRYARVLLVSGLASRAKSVSLELIEAGQGGTGFIAETRLTLADALYGEGNSFEAEQVLRQMLVDGVGIESALRKLVEFSLESKEPDLAWSWLTLLSEQPGYALVPVCGNDDKDLTLLRVRSLAAAGRFGNAIDSVKEYRTFLVQHCPQDVGMKKEAGLMLSHLYLQEKRYGKGQELIAEILKEHPLDLEPLILAQQLEAAQSGKALAGRVDEVLSDNYGNSFSGLMQAAKLERKYGATEAALRHTRMALNEVPESMTARILLADILREQGEMEAAIAVLRILAADHPHEISFVRKSLEVEFKLAFFPQIIEKLLPSGQKILGKGIVAFPDTSHLAVWQKLILARTLWADRQWVAAVAVYDSLLQPSVEMLFAQKIEEKQIELILPPPQQTFWNVITFTRPAEPDRLTVVMDPAFVMTQRGLPGGRVGADLYADYRWQQLVVRELSARRALAQGNYYQAMKEYQEVVAGNPSHESLFDLAGIYSRLGFLGKEALIYEEIERENPDYPELAEAIQRNSLKKKPRVMIDSGYSSLSGRNGYLDIQQTKGGASVWMLPNLRQELDVSWSTIHASAEETDQTLWRNRLLTTYSFYPHYNVDFITRIGADKAGGDKPDEEHGSAHHDITPLYHLEMRGRIGDDLHGFVRLRQEVVDDTVQALKEGISKRDMEGGVRLDILPRLFCGGEYLFREYSDANHQNRYHVWASYIIHSEPTLLQITYGQELLHHADGNMGRDFSYENGFSPGDHPYWSPKEYWQNSVSVHFEHQLAADVLGRSAPSYYTLDYTFGYEDGGYDFHTFSGGIFLEMNRHFLLSSSFDMIQGGEVVRKDISLSLVYRW
ncbi:MAG: tetratricopeptide repeat protein [Desulfoarculaceae bacterium]|nr:tetratricopeptide repeat protein [Desulfoarculaceae bacterium]